ncbi:MAG: hypothetical protein ACP5EP_09710 [Acidobacteriaceae bacterium]
MEPKRYEIEPRPAALGGGWRLHLIGQDMETGEESEMDGGDVPVEVGEDGKSAYVDALWAGEEWLCADDSGLRQNADRDHTVLSSTDDLT